MLGDINMANAISKDKLTFSSNYISESGVYARYCNALT